eukprot:TRINITY_DN11223_c0_g1_i2.p1 TRINITY_DN11223_c0_g1~~TRINITY_DN11223_c0_g1_i2.p1  ORF type:complete len:200 (-),score=25.09 TRINITY_DN11223_c0_g1_i2:163-762(-)
MFNQFQILLPSLVMNWRIHRFSLRSYSSVTTSVVGIVTGGSRGIGLDLSQHLVKKGIVVAAFSRSGNVPCVPNLKGFCCDVRKSEEVTKVVKTVEETLGPPSILVNCAGISHDSLLVRLKDEELNEIIDTNLKGTIFVTRSVTKSMLRNKFGVVVNIGSVVGMTGNIGQTAYSASKSALRGKFFFSPISWNHQPMQTSK